jgi:integrase
MALKINRLSALEVKNARGNAMLCDGGGLYLQVTTGNDRQLRRSWLFRYSVNGGKERWAGLGSLTDINLAAARDRASEMRRQVAAGLDPLAVRDAERVREAEAAAEKQRRSVLFLDYAQTYVRAHEGTWKNDKHRQQWLNTLGLPGGGKRRMDYCDCLHAMPVTDIDTAAVRRVLDPIWHKLPETASRLRGRIERILDAAKVDKLRDNDNPARWQGNLDKVYPPKRKVRKVRHQPALPWAKIPAFMEALRQGQGIAARCLELLVLTAVRSQEARGMLWDEIDFDAARWLIPAGRMKRDRDHVVPLSEPALALLRSMEEMRCSAYVFPGDQEGQGISDTSLRNVLRGLGLPGDVATVHGMRSSFRDFAAEATHTPNIVAEKALAHGISDGTEAAYRRGDLFEKRRELMAEWGAYCAKLPAAVAPELEPA